MLQFNAFAGGDPMRISG